MLVDFHLSLIPSPVFSIAFAQAERLARNSTVTIRIVRVIQQRKLLEQESSAIYIRCATAVASVLCRGSQQFLLSCVCMFLSSGGGTFAARGESSRPRGVREVAADGRWFPRWQHRWQRHGGESFMLNIDTGRGARPILVRDSVCADGWKPSRLFSVLVSSDRANDASPDVLSWQ